MKKLITSVGQFGPFESIQTLADRYRCDDAVDLVFSVVGASSIADVEPGDFPVPLPDLAPIKSGHILAIDRDVDAIYGAVIGNRQAEYERAEAQALEYSEAGYGGAVPPMVASWAAVKNWTGQQAAEDILEQAALWRGAQEQIRAARLLRKEQVRVADSMASIDAAVASWTAFVAAARAQLGLGGV